MADARSPIGRYPNCRTSRHSGCDLKAPPSVSESLCPQLGCAPLVVASVVLLLSCYPPPSPACRLVVIDPIVCCAFVRLASRLFRVRPPRAWGSPPARYGCFGRFGRFMPSRARCVCFALLCSPRPSCVSMLTRLVYTLSIETTHTTSSVGVAMDTCCAFFFPRERGQVLPGSRPCLVCAGRTYNADVTPSACARTGGLPTKAAM